MVQIIYYSHFILQNSGLEGRRAVRERENKLTNTGEVQHHINTTQEKNWMPESQYQEFHFLTDCPL